MFLLQLYNFLICFILYPCHILIPQHHPLSPPPLTPGSPQHPPPPPPPLCVCLQYKHPRSTKRVIRSDNPITSVFPVTSQKCDFGAEHRCRSFATLAGKHIQTFYIHVYIPASCEKFPHSSQLNFWSTESIFNQFSVFFWKYWMLFASDCNLNTLGQWKESLGQTSQSLCSSFSGRTNATSALSLRVA
jgi:hypothetical protein